MEQIFVDIIEWMHAHDTDKCSRSTILKKLKQDMSVTYPILNRLSIRSGSCNHIYDINEAWHYALGAKYKSLRMSLFAMQINRFYHYYDSLKNLDTEWLFILADVEYSMDCHIVFKNEHDLIQFKLSAD